MRFLPSPRLSMVIFLAWLAISNSLHPGHLVFALVLAMVIPWLTRRALPDVPVIRSPIKAVQYLLLVLYDICVANLKVARLAVSPLTALNPKIVTVPLDVDDAAVASMLAATVTLTPGTVSVELNMQTRELVVHALDAPNADEVIREIKSRYETRLLEIFKC